MHGIIHTLVTAASRGANAAKVQQSWMDRVHGESLRGSQRYPGGWKIGGAGASYIHAFCTF
jgi:hypothetical protein